MGMREHTNWMDEAVVKHDVQTRLLVRDRNRIVDINLYKPVALESSKELHRCVFGQKRRPEMNGKTQKSAKQRSRESGF